MDTIHKLYLRLVGFDKPVDQSSEIPADHFTVKFAGCPKPGPIHRGEKILILAGSSGRGSYLFNGRKLEMREGSLLLVLPEDVLAPGPYDSAYREHQVSFSMSFLHGIPIDLQILTSILKDLRTNPGLSQESLSLSQMEEQLTACLHLLNSPERYRIEMIQRIFSILLLGLAGALQVRQNKGNNPWETADRKQYYCEAFLDLVARHYRTERSVGFYADKMCLTSKYLSSLIKEISGKTASEWIDEFVLSEARKLLETSLLNVQQIAYTLNFPNPSFFGRYFKNRTGVSPLRYRVGSLPFTERSIHTKNENDEKSSDWSPGAPGNRNESGVCAVLHSRGQGGSDLFEFYPEKPAEGKQRYGIRCNGGRIR